MLNFAPMSEMGIGVTLMITNPIKPIVYEENFTLSLGYGM